VAALLVEAEQHLEVLAHRVLVPAADAEDVGAPQEHVVTHERGEGPGMRHLARIERSYSRRVNQPITNEK
jgi:hypothetical protein